jgi:hypothetical protein
MKTRGYYIKQIEKISKLKIEDIEYIFKSVLHSYPFNGNCNTKVLAKVLRDLKNGYVAVPF